MLEGLYDLFFNALRTSTSGIFQDRQTIFPVKANVFPSEKLCQVVEKKEANQFTYLNSIQKPITMSSSEPFFFIQTTSLLKRSNFLQCRIVLIWSSLISMNCLEYLIILMPKINIQVFCLCTQEYIFSLNAIKFYV